MTQLHVLVLSTMLASGIGLAQESRRSEMTPADRPSNGRLGMIVRLVGERANQTGERNAQESVETPGELTVVLRNVSNEPVAFMITIPTWDYEFTIIDAVGSKVALTEVGKHLPQSDKERSGWMLSRSSKILAPNEEYSEKVDLRPYFRFEPGQTYTVQVRRWMGQAFRTSDSKEELRCSVKLTMPLARRDQ